MKVMKHMSPHNSREKKMFHEARPMYSLVGRAGGDNKEK